MLYDAIAVIFFLLAVFGKFDTDIMIKLFMVSGLFAVCGAITTTFKSFFEVMNNALNKTSDALDKFKEENKEYFQKK